MPFPRILNLTILGRENLVNFLGIPFGQTPTKFDSYFNSRKPILRWVWRMVSTCKNCPWSTRGSADDDPITCVAFRDAGGNTRRDHATVAMDAESICAWSELQKKGAKHVHLISKEILYYRR